MRGGLLVVGGGGAARRRLQPALLPLPPPPHPPTPLPPFLVLRRLLLPLLLLLLLAAPQRAAAQVTLTCVAASTIVGPLYELPESPTAVAVDVQNPSTLIVADGRARAVLRYDLVTRAVVPWLGLTGSRGFADGVGSSARFDSMTDIAQHPSTGDIYIGSLANGCVRRATPDGNVTTIGQCANPGNADGAGAGAGAGAQLCGPISLAVDSPNGVLYAQQASGADCGALLRAVDLATFAVTTVGALVPDGECVSAIAYSPARGSVLAATGCGTNRLLEYIVASNTTRIVVDLNGTAFSSAFLGGVSLAADQSAAFVSDTLGHTILKVELATSAVSLFAGGAASCPGSSSPVCGGEGSAAKILAPSFIHASPVTGGPILVTTQTLPFIYYISPGARVDIFSQSSYSPGGPASVGSGRLTTRFSSLASMAFDARDSLLVVDSGAHALLSVSPAGDVAVVAGQLNVPGPPLAGPALAPHFSSPTHLAVNASSGIVYISDRGNNRVQVFDPAAGTVVPFAGTGDGGFAVADGDALTEAQFFWLCGVAVLGDSVFVLDEYSAAAVGRLRRVRGGRVSTFPALTGCGSCISDALVSSLSVGASPAGDGSSALFLVASSQLFNSSAGYIELLPDAPGGEPRCAYVQLTVLSAVAAIAAPSLMDMLTPTLGGRPSFVFARFTNAYYACFPASTGRPCQRFLSSQGAALGQAVPSALDGVMGGDAVVNTAFLAANSQGELFIMDRGNGKLLHAGRLQGEACDEAASRNGSGVCRAGTFINYTSQTCLPCYQATNYSSALPYAAYCNGEAPAAPPAAVGSPAAALPVAVIAALSAVGAALAAAAAAALFYRRRESQRKRREAAQPQTTDSAVNVLVSAINASRSSTGISMASFGGSEGASVALNPFAAASAAAAGAAPTSAISTLRFADLRPEPHVAPLFGGFGVVFCATWVSRGIRVAIKVPKDLVVSSFLPAEAAAELVKEAQGIVRASDGNVNEHVVRLFGVAQGDGGAAWARACERARALHFSKKDGGGAAAAAAAAASGGGGRAVGSGGSSSRQADSVAAGGSESPLPEAARQAFNLIGLVMAWESGGTLADALLPPPSAMRAPWPSSTGDRLRLAREVAVGLFHLHRVGIVHGDLKLENVLLSGDSDRHVRLADFGLADLQRQRDSMMSVASRLSTAVTTDHKRGASTHPLRTKSLPALQKLTPAVSSTP